MKEKCLKNKRKQSPLWYYFVILLISLILSLIIFINYRVFIYAHEEFNQKQLKELVKKQKQTLPKTEFKPELIKHGSREKQKIALTFDADMTYEMLTLLKKGFVKSWYNREIKKTLESKKVKATIFFTGLWVQTYPWETKELAKNPLIEVGNHSYSHPAFTNNCYKLPFIKDDQVEDEVLKAQRIIKETAGISAKYFRFPGGCYKDIDLEIISKLNLKIIQWDVVSGDAFNKNEQQIIQNVESKVQNGSIIVFHINNGPYSPKTNDALLKIIPDLKKRGFEFVTISELLEKE